MEIDDKIKITKFDPKSILTDATVMFLGKRRSGKSWAMRDIMYHNRHIPAGVVFSGTEIVPFFSKFIPDVYIYPHYNANVVKNMISRSAKNVSKSMEKYGGDGKRPSNNRYVIIDDLQNESAVWKNEETVKTLFFNGRHYNYLLLIALQFITGIPPSLRTNLDYVFIFNDQSRKNRKNIYENYAAMLPSFEVFNRVMDLCTQGFRCMVLKLTGKGEVFYYEAKERLDFTVGCKDMWNYHKKKYKNPNKDENSKDENHIVKKTKITLSKDFNRANLF